MFGVLLWAAGGGERVDVDVDVDAVNGRYVVDSCTDE